MLQIKTALISVFDKNSIEPLAKKLSSLGIKILSTGGTEKFLTKIGLNIQKVEDITSYPSILGGRVKTLHPKIFGGILSRRTNKNDILDVERFDIPKIDLVVVDLYPFEKTVETGKNEEEIIEKIDIGGISLIRAAAKNFKDVVCISSRDQYSNFVNLLDSEGPNCKL